MQAWLPHSLLVIPSRLFVRKTALAGVLSLKTGTQSSLHLHQEMLRNGPTEVFNLLDHDG